MELILKMENVLKVWTQTMYEHYVREELRDITSLW